MVYKFEVLTDGMYGDCNLLRKKKGWIHRKMERLTAI